MYHLFTKALGAASLASSLVGAVSLPDCQIYAPLQKTLTTVRTANLSVPNLPFGLVYAKQKDFAFVSLVHAEANSTLGVLNTSTFPPTLSHRIALPPAYITEAAFGITLTHDGKHVLVADGPGATIVDAALAIANSSNAVVGSLNGTVGTQRPGVEAIEVITSLDDEFAFVSQEYGATNVTDGNVDVFKLSTAVNGSVSGTAVGFLNLGHAVVGTALSPNGKIMYAVSELSNVVNATQGLLSVVNVTTLETTPSQAQLYNASAGCGPVRIIVSSDGKVVWVTARESNHLLAFNATKLNSGASNALIASVQVGQSPVGLMFARNETRIITADSNRFNYANATSGLSVVDVQAALGGSTAAVLGRIPTGRFPRELALSPDGNTMLVADYTSSQIQAVDVTTLP